MNLSRREFLVFLGAATAATATGSLTQTEKGELTWPEAQAATVPFEAVKGPMPYNGVNIAAAQQPVEYGQYVIQDDLVLPTGFTYDVLAAWGDPVGETHFGYNNDYLSFVPTGPNQGFLTVNFEYISDQTWAQTYPQVIQGQDLEIDKILADLESRGVEELDVSGMSDRSAVKGRIQRLSMAALTDQGIGVISIRRQQDGRWVRTFSQADRRITGISGLENSRQYLKATGPATAIFQKSQGQGYIDGLSTRIIGTYGNCSGGTTPWGTVLSAEENFQDNVPEAVYADGTPFPPSSKPFTRALEGQGNALGLAGHKYGWVVEVDPANPNDYGVKHTWLGRYRHEAVGIRVVVDRPLAFYSGCDRRGGHLYKFISRDPVTNPTDKVNSALLSNGLLYAAKFNPDGTGRWLPLAPNTPVDPILPSTVGGGMVHLPKRPDGGYESVTDDAVATAFKTQYRTLADLYAGNDREQQGAILIDAHYAGNAIGATTTARPEDTDVRIDGSLFITFTSGTPGGDGGPDTRIFKGPKGEVPYEYGWIMKLTEDGSDPAALTFRWQMIALGGEPADGGLGFSNPDNLAFDPKDNLWLVTDMSTSAHNKAVGSRTDAEGKAIKQTDLLGLYGNNSIWYMPLTGDQAGEAIMFGYGPMESEMTGPYFTADNTALFLSAQHPGERHGMRQAMATETRQYAMKTTTGQPFTQTREVPIGSNWPDKGPNDPPKPAVVVIRRIDGKPIS